MTDEEYYDMVRSSNELKRKGVAAAAEEEQDAQKKKKPGFFRMILDFILGTFVRMKQAARRLSFGDFGGPGQGAPAGPRLNKALEPRTGSVEKPLPGVRNAMQAGAVENARSAAVPEQGKKMGEKAGKKTTASRHKPSREELMAQAMSAVSALDPKALQKCIDDAVENGIEPCAVLDAKTEQGNTTLHIASMLGNPEIVRILLENGADPLAKNDAGVTALELSKNEDVKQLLQQEMRQKEDLPQLISHSDAVAGVVQAVLAADPHRLERIIKSAEFSSLDVPSVLSRQDYKGNTPLHYACMKNFPEIVQVLVEHGANTDIKNIQDKTPMDICNPGEATFAILQNARAAAVEDHDTAFCPA